jgi:hypothetical protein
MRPRARPQTRKDKFNQFFSILSNVTGQLSRRGDSGFAARMRRVACPSRAAMDSVVRLGMPTDMLVGPASIAVLSVTTTPEIVFRGTAAPV